MERAFKWWALSKTESTIRLTEDPKPAMFLPFLQSPTSLTCLVVRSERDPQQLAPAIRSALRGLDASLPLNIQTWTQGLDIALFPSHVATVALGVLGGMGAMLSHHRHLWNGCVLGEQTAAGVGNSHGPGREAQRSVAGGVGTAVEIAGYWFGGRLAARNSGEQGCWLTSCIRQLRAIRWCWRAWFWRCCCWVSWLHGSRRNARFRLIR